MAQYSPIIEAHDLLNIYEIENIVLIDASNAHSDYQNKHLKGAIFIDLETQLSSENKNPKNGGRHPLPSVESFTKTLSNLGITNDDHIVIYDNKNGANAAARLWWMLTSLGHKKVQVLNGGFQAALKVNYPTETGSNATGNKRIYQASSWSLKTADINEVEKAANSEDYVIVDVRDPKRFQGLHEPIDSVAGHIPNAINMPLSDNLDANGLFLPPDKLKSKYQAILSAFGSNNTIFHCGSGVTACHSLLAIAYAGFEIPKLYVGSWSEWSRNDKPIATNQLQPTIIKRSGDAG